MRLALVAAAAAPVSASASISAAIAVSAPISAVSLSISAAIVAAAVSALIPFSSFLSFFIFRPAAISGRFVGVTAASAGFSASLSFSAVSHPLAFPPQGLGPPLYFLYEMAEGGGNVFAGHSPPKLLSEVFDFPMEYFIDDVGFVKAGCTPERFRLVDFRLQADGQCGVCLLVFFVNPAGVEDVLEAFLRRQLPLGELMIESFPRVVHRRFRRLVR